MNQHGYSLTHFVAGSRCFLRSIRQLISTRPAFLPNTLQPDALSDLCWTPMRPLPWCTPLEQTHAHHHNNTISFDGKHSIGAHAVLAQPGALCRACAASAFRRCDGVLEFWHGKARKLGDDDFAVHR